MRNIPVSDDYLKCTEIIYDHIHLRKGKLVTSGMGTRRASQATRALVEMTAPELLISFGIAGAVLAAGWSLLKSGEP